MNHNSFEEKISSMVEEAYPLDIRSFTCAPAFALPILTRLFEKAREEGKEPKDIYDIWPNLRMYMFSGSSVLPYEERLRNFLGHKIPFLEVYSSTESPFAYQYDPSRPQELLLDIESCFFLFQKEGEDDGKLFQLHELEKNQRYSMLVTTFGELINYKIGDIVQVSSTEPPLIKVIGREKEEANMAGTERISLATINELIKEVEAKFELNFSLFFLCPYKTEDQRMGYHWTFETDEELKDPNAVLDELDKRLIEKNSGYRASRDSSVRLIEPKLTIIPEGSINKYILQSKLFGQRKFLTVHNQMTDTDKFFNYLEENGIESFSFVKD